MGYINRQLIEALIEQVDGDLMQKTHHPLGTILIARGWMTVPQVERALDEIVARMQKNGEAPSPHGRGGEGDGTAS